MPSSPRRESAVKRRARDGRASYPCRREARHHGWFVRHFAKRTMEAVERHVADTETEAHLKRVREVIRAAGSEGISKSEITRASQWLKARDRDDILATLVEGGDIKPVMRNTAGRSAMVFQLVSTRRQRQK